MAITVEPATVPATNAPAANAREAVAPEAGAASDDEPDTVVVGGVAVPRYMTLELFEFYPFEGDEHVELVLGEVRVTLIAAGAHSRIVRNIFRALDAHVTPRTLGEVYGEGAGYVLAPLPHTLRGPDVSFVRAGRLPDLVPLRGAFRVTPDLAVEVLSPNDTYVEVDERREQMFETGAPCWWLVDPRRWRVEVHVPGGARRVLREGDVLDGAPLLPEFAMPVADVFTGVERPPRLPRGA